MSADFGRWPWSWPVDVPVKIRGDGDEVYVLTSRGPLYNAQAVYRGSYGGSGSGGPPFKVDFMVGRSYLRHKLRSGEWQTSGEPTP